MSTMFYDGIEGFGPEPDFDAARLKFPWWDEVSDVSFKKFVKFDGRFPEVRELLIKYARQAKDAGKDRYSIYTVLWRVNWDLYLNSRGKRPDWSMIGNALGCCYSRLLMQILPDEFGGVFETRVFKKGDREEDLDDGWDSSGEVIQ